MTICYHTTSAAFAAAILSGGFEDRTGIYPPFDDEITGVFLCEEPLLGGFGLPLGTPAEKYGQTLRVEFPVGFDLDDFLYDRNPGDKSPRTWHMPASAINAHATVTPLSDGDMNDPADQ
jgi:hypothetical protein